MDSASSTVPAALGCSSPPSHRFQVVRKATINEESTGHTVHKWTAVAKLRARYYDTHGQTRYLWTVDNRLTHIIYVISPETAEHLLSSRTNWDSTLGLGGNAGIAPV